MGILKMAESVLSGEPERWEGKNRSYYNKSSSYQAPEVSSDTQADAKVVLIVIACLLLIAMHFVSGWTFDI
jgi:hypothetical protein